MNEDLKQSKITRMLIQYLYPLLLVSLLVFVSQEIECQNHHQYFDKSIIVDSNNIPRNSRQFYFPTKLFPEVELICTKGKGSTIILKTKIIKNETDSFSLRVFSGILFSMKEPLLFNHPVKQTIYRFTYIRTFDSPLVISIKKMNNEYYLYWKIERQVDNFENNDTLISKQKEISFKEWEVFENKINRLKFWDLGRDGFIGEDGAFWILEGVDPSKYHVVSRWSPESDLFYEACMYLISLTDLSKEKIY